MSSRDSEVREHLSLLIGAFATPEQETQRSGFHLYCMEVAMGFKLIYRELKGHDPPGLQLGELRKASDFVSHKITVGYIDQIKNGTASHQDVQDVLDEIVKVKGLANNEITELKKTNEDLQKTIENLVPEWNKQIKLRDKRETIKIAARTKPLHEEIKALKKQISDEGKQSALQVQEMKTNMDAAKEALQKAERQIADLTAASEMSVRLNRIEGALTAALSRLESSDINLAKHIESLLPFDRNGKAIGKDAQAIKELLPKDLRTVNSAVIGQGQLQKITSLEEAARILEESNKKLTESLKSEQANVEKLSPLTGELAAEKEKVEKLTAANKRLDASFKDLQNIILNVSKCNPERKLADKDFDTKIITDAFNYIKNLVIPTEISKEDGDKIRNFMKLSYTLMVHYSAYRYVKKTKNSLENDSFCFKNIAKIADVLEDDLTKKIFIQLSAASHGFNSLQQASECLTDAEKQIGFVRDESCFYNETSNGSTYIFEIQVRADKTAPLAMQVIDFATKKLSLFSSTMAFAVRWMGESKSKETQIKIAKLLMDAMNTLGLNVHGVEAILSIELFNKLDFDIAVNLCPPLLIGQILSNKIRADSVVNISTGKKTKIGECYEAAQKLIKHLSDPSQTPPIKFNANDVEILKLLHFNEGIIPKPS